MTHDLQLQQDLNIMKLNVKMYLYHPKLLKKQCDLRLVCQGYYTMQAETAMEVLVAYIAVQESFVYIPERNTDVEEVDVRCPLTPSKDKTFGPSGFQTLTWTILDLVSMQLKQMSHNHGLHGPSKWHEAARTISHHSSVNSISRSIPSPRRPHHCFAQVMQVLLLQIVQHFSLERSNEQITGKDVV